MNFSSDNATGASPEIMDALARANEGFATAYGNDALSAQVEKKIADIFETDAQIFSVSTGTAANALALASMTAPYGGIICHPEAHINVDECGAPEMYTGGAKLLPLDGADGKITAKDLADVLSRPDRGVHQVTPQAVSLSQATEAGTVYTQDEVTALCDIAHAHGLHVHMDGARFANALVSLDAHPADITWRAGVDILCFGASKNGAMAAEAIVVFNKTLVDGLDRRRKRAGHLLSKMRFIAAQFDAYLENDLWLNNARHANACATHMADALCKLPNVRLAYPVNANEIFVHMPKDMIEGLLAKGFFFYRWDGDNGTLVRLVTAFNTQMRDVEALIDCARDLA